MTAFKHDHEISDPALRRVTAPGYDLAGNGTGRILRHWLRHLLLPFGNFGGGPGLKATLVLAVSQRGGWLLGWGLLLLEPRLKRWLGWFNRRRGGMP
jgi:hypothetical protein